MKEVSRRKMITETLEQELKRCTRKMMYTDSRQLIYKRIRNTLNFLGPKVDAVLKEWQTVVKKEKRTEGGGS